MKQRWLTQAEVNEMWGRHSGDRWLRWEDIPDEGPMPDPPMLVDVCEHGRRNPCPICDPLIELQQRR